MYFPDFPSYFRLMLLAARWPLSPSDREQICRTIDEQIDWNEFLRVVQAHRLGPLALEGLTITATKQVPESVLDLLTTIQKANSNRVVRNALETQRIAKVFRQQGFQVTVLKGPLLSEIIYGDPFRRFSVDVDLLTTQEHLAQQILCMEDLGYELVMPYCHLTPSRIRSYSQYRKDFSFRHKRTGMMVDLHWRLFNNPEHQGNQLGTSLVPIEGKLFGDGLFMLSRVDQFLYCAAHGVTDAWIYLKSLADFAAFLHTLTPQEIQTAVARSTEIGLLPKLSSAVHMARNWMGVPLFEANLLPADDTLHVTMYRSVVETLRNSSFAPDRADIRFATEFQLERLLVPGWKGILNIVGRYLFRPRIWCEVDLPDSVFWLYAVLGLLTPPRFGKADRSLTPTSDH